MCIRDSVNDRILFVLHSKSAQAEEVANLFESLPGCESVDVKRNKRNGVRGMAFATFASANDAARAMAELHGVEFPRGSGTKLKVMLSQTSSPSPHAPMSKSSRQRRASDGDVPSELVVVNPMGAAAPDVVADDEAGVNDVSGVSSAALTAVLDSAAATAAGEDDDEDEEEDFDNDSAWTSASAAHVPSSSASSSFVAAPHPVAMPPMPMMMHHPNMVPGSYAHGHGGGWDPATGAPTPASAPAPSPAGFFHPYASHGSPFAWFTPMPVPVAVPVPHHQAHQFQPHPDAASPMPPSSLAEAGFMPSPYAMPQYPSHSHPLAHPHHPHPHPLAQQHQPTMSDFPADATRLHVSFGKPLPERDVSLAFESAAPGLVYVSRHRDRTFAFVKYASPGSAMLAMARLNGATLCGQRLRVTLADPPPSSAAPPSTSASAVATPSEADAALGRKRQRDNVPGAAPKARVGRSAASVSTSTDAATATTSASATPE